MKKPNLFWGPNLKFLRNRKKLSQDALAGALGITRVKLNALENGITKNPMLEDLVMIAGYFHIAVDTLLKVDLSAMGEFKLRELEGGNDVYLTGSKIRVLAITVDSSNQENLEYVPKTAKAGYREGFNDPQFIAGLPKFSLPNLSPKKTYRMFPTEGRSMEPIPEHSFIITEYVTDWQQMAPDTLCIVILKTDQEFLFKAVTNQVKEKQTFLLRSLNPDFAEQEVHADDVLEFWQYHSHWTKEVPMPVTAPLDVLMKEVKEMKQTLKKLVESAS